MGIRFCSGIVTIRRKLVWEDCRRILAALTLVSVAK